MLIDIHSLTKIKEIDPIGGLISIRDKGYDSLYTGLDNKWEHILPLEFDDVTKYHDSLDLLHPFHNNVKKTRELIFFNESMAKEIVSFAEKIKKYNLPLHIHCFAGKSRSQAVGHCLNTYFNLFLEKNLPHFQRNIIENNSRFMGNHDVIKVMNDVLYT
jgi:predicted protein tyrosine phosphatase